MVQNPLKPISYTNKDFNTIFVELLDIVKELSSKWDPSISNESDPGVILLKADAIIADKNNYNIDKNTLENFPETATQELNVRNLYSQLAYKMPWYRSASCNVYFRYLGKDDSALQQGQQLLIPKYTMITDADNSVVYTTIEDAVIPSDTLNTTVKALQGILNIHEVHGTSNIQLSDIDYNNRLYLNDYQVAQNGVFIENTENGNQWTQVDNLAVEPNGNYYFEFGIDARNSVCYIEFPEDVSKLIKSGITIRYIVSEGAQGNIAAKLLDRFYNDTSGTIDTKQVPLNNDNIQLYNIDGTHDGYDPESIQQAFKSYKRVAGTFNTLVTLRDYIDAIYNSGYASNDVVTDRLTDIQTAYKTVTENKVNKYYTYITEEKVEYKFDKVHKDQGYSIQASDNLYTYTTNSSGHISSTTYVSSGTVSPAGGTDYLQLVDDSKVYMDAFDLKLYVLHNPGIIKTVADYESSFDVEYSDSEVIERIKNYINEEQTILHDFKNILPDVPFMFFNEYPVGIKIVPQQKLSDLEIYQVKSNIVAALMEECNAHSCEFGVEPDYNLIYDTILNSDERIKLVVLDDFDYTTFACYYDAVEGIFKKIPISDSKSSFIIHIKNSDDVQKLYDMNVYDKVKLKNCYIVADDNINITETITLTNGQYVLNYKCVDQSSIVVTNSTGTVQRTGEDYSYDSTDNAIIDLGNDLQDGDKVTYQAYVKGYIYIYDGEELQVYSTILKDVRLDIICKSILAGRTPLYDTYSDFIYTIMQQNTQSLNISHITSGVGIYPFSNSTSAKNKTITFPDGKTLTTIEPYTSSISSNGTYKLLSNEMIRIYETSYKANVTYSNYIKYQFYRNNGSQEVIPANSNYQLAQNDRLAFFWRDINEKEAPWNYQLYKGNDISSFIDNEGNINNPVLISPNFTLHPITDSNFILGLGDEYGEKGIINYGDSLYEPILDLTTDLGATNTIDIIEPVQTKLNKDKNYIYVITNNIYDNKYNMQFEEILDNSSDEGYLYRYTLQQDEYFIYTNKDKSEFEVLGTGTMIGIYSETALSSLPEISNKIVKFEEIAIDGITAIKDFQSFSYDNLFIREQQVTTLSEGDTIEVVLSSGVSNEVNFYSWEDTSLATVDKITYTDNSNNTTSMEIDNITYYSPYARAYLNINCSNTNPQQLYQVITQNSVYKSFQFVAYPNYTGDNYSWVRFPATTAPAGGSFPDNNNYIQAYNPIQALGGFNIDISYIDLYSNSIDNRVYLYRNVTQTNMNPIENNLILIESSISDVGLTLVEGSYIMKVENKDESNTFSIQYKPYGGSYSNLTPINSDISTLGKGTYYYKIPNAGLLKFILSADMTPLTVYPLVKITDIDKFNEKYDISFDDITSGVKELDYNNKFKYDYIIPEDDLIEDPLKNISLFNEKHILNQFTIPYARVNLSSDITDSYITIINNR